MGLFSRSSRAGAALLAALGGLTLLLGVLAVLAPVRADDPVVRWPKADAPASSTVLPLSPYRPLEFDATIPCGALHAVDAQDGTALSTSPEGPGLRVTAGSGTVHFGYGVDELLAEPLPAGDCAYRVHADAGGVQVLRDGHELVSRPDLLPPQVAELASDVPGAPGLGVELHTDARYESGPTAVKTVLLIAHACCLALLLVLAWRRWRGTQSMHRLRVPRPAPADAVVVLVSVAWVLLGPANMDDGWYMMMARNAEASGYLGNFVYMYNATENPFGLSQYMLQVWGWLGGWSLWWMRLVPTLCGLATWALLRVLLATMLGRTANLRAVPWALLVAHLVWYLPYGTTLRPEPVIVLFAAATLVFAEAARAQRSVGALAAGTVCATLAVTASPSGVVAAAPLLLSVPWVLRWLREQSWAERAGVLLLAAASASVIVPVGFADATLGDVLEATDVHKWYYLSFSWYEEFEHYNTLLNTAGWARRLPVLLALGVLAVVTVASGRGGMGRDPIRRLVLTSAITTAMALGLIALSPTKWVNHFHSIAAAPTVLLAAVLLRSPLPRRAGAVISIGSVLVLIGAVSLSFAGKNWWIPFTDAGQRFGNHVNPAADDQLPHIGPLFLHNPLPWLTLALGTWLWARWRRRSGKLVRISADRAVLVTASLGSVLLMGALFVYAPIAQAPGWTVARSGIQTAFGDGCGLASDARVQLPVQRQLGAPVGQAEVYDDFAGSGAQPPIPTSPWGSPTALWHDARPDGTTPSVGKLVTPWYPLAGEGTNITVPVAGGLEGQELRVEFGHAAGDGFTVTGSAELTPDLRRSALREWQQVSAPVPQARPDAARVVAVDRITGANSWLAVAEPKATESRPVTEVTRGRTVFANHIAAPLWPCVNQVSVHNGITETPEVRLTADEGLPSEWLDNISNLPWAGAWVQTSRTWVQTKLPAELPGGPPRLPWGNVFVNRYLHPVGQYDLDVRQVTRQGWTRLPTLADNDYGDIDGNAGVQRSDRDGDARD
ncbi:arabinosyltransferase domain-containing protein [Saccharopolyspora sp. HNM0986]|uniref:arabinosyltransferase domain-containing protein n=1 Tax=Saccharopolyspora galaxeae TaxID=2781241 RepID=UPI00190D964C|nr:arabinosyltransferase domain-containing protein [Saccharopolyspora sp. HNM0986]MBK0865450.1 arabinosyltransferase domain-containing protein [Saccharopolyspora sp. HNM0986]